MVIPAAHVRATSLGARSVRRIEFVVREQYVLQLSAGAKGFAVVWRAEGGCS